MERWPAVAGWRGLKDPAVREYFNNTFYAFEKVYGKEELLLPFLNMSYQISYGGSDAEGAYQGETRCRPPQFCGLRTR